MKLVRLSIIPLLAAAGALMSLAACNLLVETRDRPDRCGDGVLDHWEACEGAELRGATCESVDGTRGLLRCTGACTFNTSLCGGGPECGNGARNAGEACDGADLGGRTCETQGYLEGGELRCHPNCTVDVSLCLGDYSYCGNGVWDEGEGEACETGEGVPGCTSACTVEPGFACENTDGQPSICTPVCGDGQVVGDEPCDGELIGEGVTCESVGHYPGTLACVAETCTLELSGCGGSCGDGVLQTPPEECEGADAGADCADWGFSSGPLSCAGCRMDFTGCSPEVPPGAFERVAVGGAHTCGVRGGKVYCWGDNTHGQCGVDSGGSFRPTPVEVVFSPSRTVFEVTAGERHTCAITSTGSIFCWGDNGLGQLGNGGTTSSHLPVQVSTTFTALQVGAGVDHTCAVLDLGGGPKKVYCWGDNTYGQLGGVPATGSATPTVVFTDAADVIETLAVGAHHACAGTYFIPKKIVCWGRNDAGQLGIGSAEPFVNGVSEVTAISGTDDVLLAAGGAHTCAQVYLGEEMRLYCWGANGHGQLGTGGTDSTGVPVQVPTVLGAQGGQISVLGAGRRNTCALIEHDLATEFLCWGSYERGQLAVDTVEDALEPLLLAAPQGVESFALGGDHVCAIAWPGSVALAYCWGANDLGQLGDQTRADAHAPVLVSGQNLSK